MRYRMQHWHRQRTGKVGNDTVIGVYNVNTTGTDKIAHTSYSYEIDYLEKPERPQPILLSELRLMQMQRC